MQGDKDWARLKMPASDVYHVIPVNDLKNHQDSAYCWCCPEVENQGNGVVVIHNAADGRELLEDTQGH